MCRQQIHRILDRFAGKNNNSFFTPDCGTVATARTICLWAMNKRDQTNDMPVVDAWKRREERTAMLFYNKPRLGSKHTFENYPIYWWAANTTLYIQKYHQQRMKNSIWVVLHIHTHTPRMRCNRLIYRVWAVSRAKRFHCGFYKIRCCSVSSSNHLKHTFWEGNKQI